MEWTLGAPCFQSSGATGPAGTRPSPQNTPRTTQWGSHTRKRKPRNSPLCARNQTGKQEDKGGHSPQISKHLRKTNAMEKGHQTQHMKNETKKPNRANQPFQLNLIKIPKGEKFRIPVRERAQLAWDGVLRQLGTWAWAGLGRRPQAAGDVRLGRGSHVVGQERLTGLNNLHHSMACAAHLLSLGGLESWCQAEGTHVTNPR